MQSKDFADLSIIATITYDNFIQVEYDNEYKINKSLAITNIPRLTELSTYFYLSFNVTKYICSHEYSHNQI